MTANRPKAIIHFRQPYRPNINEKLVWSNLVQYNFPDITAAIPATFPLRLAIVRFQGHLYSIGDKLRFAKKSLQSMFLQNLLKVPNADSTQFSASISYRISGDYWTLYRASDQSCDLRASNRGSKVCLEKQLRIRFMSK